MQEMKGPPVLHASRHENGGADEISVLGLVGTVVFVPYNGKIADITHADTNKHTLDLATALTETREITAIILNNYRMAGTGSLYAYSNEGASLQLLSNSGTNTAVIGLAAGTSRLQYNLQVANDDYDLYCDGYWVKA